jgi:hypothetical protein
MKVIGNSGTPGSSTLPFHLSIYRSRAFRLNEQPFPPQGPFSLIVLGSPAQGLSNGHAHSRSLVASAHARWNSKEGNRA